MNLTRFLLLASCACPLLFAGVAKPVLNGTDKADWRFFSPECSSLDEVCTFKPDGSVSIKGKPNGYIVSTKPYKNYRLHLEWRWLAPKGNSGVLIHQGGPDKLWPLSIQFQMKVGAVGELLPMDNFSIAEKLAPNVKGLPKLAADSEKPVGEWNSADILVRDGSVECTVNGTLQGKATQCKPAEGLIGLQLEGVPFEIRNVTLEQL